MTRRIAFIAHTNDPQRFLNDPAFIYRCENPALALRELGHQVELLHYTQFPNACYHLLRMSTPYDLVIFHRPRWRFGFSLLIRALRQRGTICVADFDDLVFDIDYAQVSPGVVNGLVSLAQTKKNFRRHQRALLCFQQLGCITSVSTAPLVGKVQELMKKHGRSQAHVELMYNSVHWHWRQHPIEAKPERPRITYFPGTRSHDRDFAQIIPALAQVLAQQPNWQLHITGVLHTTTKTELLNELQQSGVKVAEQLVFMDRQPFEKYREHVAQSWLNLAPLEQNEFNRHKSALKAIEASFYGVVTVATAIPDMLRFEQSGAVLIDEQRNNQTEAWSQAISTAMLETPRAELRTSNLEKYTVEQHANHLLTIAAQGPHA